MDFVEGKFGKPVPVVDSFVFYPKDKQRVRFVCKTRGCNETITLQEDGDGRPFATRRPQHGHPNHEYAVENLIHMQRLRAEVKDRHNRSVPKKLSSRVFAAKQKRHGEGALIPGLPGGLERGVHSHEALGILFSRERSLETASTSAMTRVSS